MKKVEHKTSPYKVIGYYLVGVLSGLIGMVAMARIVWHSKFYPNVTVAGVEIGGMKREEAQEKLSRVLAERVVELSANGYSWQLNASLVGVEAEQSLNNAYSIGRRLDISDYTLLFINRPTNISLAISEGTSEGYNKIVEEIARVLEIPNIEPSLVVQQGEVVVKNGSDGVVIDQEKLWTEVTQRVASGKSEQIEIPLRQVGGELTETELNELKTKGQELTEKQLTLTLDDQRVILDGNELLAFIYYRKGIGVEIEKEKLLDYVEGIANSYDRMSEDAKFEFVEGKVTEFSPGKDGIRVIIENTGKKAEEAIKTLLTTDEKMVVVEVEVERTVPQITIDKINELGIKERIGRGESYYAHSIPNRIYNVGLAAERINSALIPPGAEVSFNKLVGEVSAATGYRSAYIISQGRTVLGDGGGLCQVSTTMFRAAMSAGLPILERWGHSYRVSYYEQNSKPGVDATVIAPSKDFRFKNDTPGHILIQTINDSKNLHLVIEIYGTSDGRVATISEPKVWGITPPLPTVYQDDPTLAVGTTKQVDWAAGGARTSFEYKVTRNGETLQDQTFSTVYRPWAAVYLRGTAQ